MKTVGPVRIVTDYGQALMFSHLEPNGLTHLTVVGVDGYKSDLQLRVQSACVTSSAIHIRFCDCAEQMRESLRLIVTSGHGAFIYLDQEGRGHGLHRKVEAMERMASPADTVEAFTEAGMAPDVRDYSVVHTIMTSLEMPTRVRLLTNNPSKARALESFGCRVEVVPIVCQDVGPAVVEYLQAKRQYLGHVIPSDLGGKA